MCCVIVSIRENVTHMGYLSCVEAHEKSTPNLTPGTRKLRPEQPVASPHGLQPPIQAQNNPNILPGAMLSVLRALINRPHCPRRLYSTRIPVSRVRRAVP
jgi:hypothetical protein